MYQILDGDEPDSLDVVEIAMELNLDDEVVAGCMRSSDPADALWRCVSR